METIKPIKINSKKLSPSEKLTSAEMGKLWATYVGNSMSGCILRYFLQHCEDEEIRTLLENGLSLSEEFMKTIEGIFEKENFPIPVGFTEEDVNLGAPRLYEDQFYVHYVKYAAKAGLSIYAIALPLVMREDVRKFFVHCSNCTATLLCQVNEVLIGKGFISKPPVIPVPEKVDFVSKQKYLSGFVGDIRPLHALEITHLYDNIENNTTSKALLLGFTQVVKMEKIRHLFKRGLSITDQVVEHCQEKLHHENLPSLTLLDHLVTTSTFSPFSDKLMLFHKVDMFSMKIRQFGGSMAVNGRRDIGLLYTKSLVNVSLFVDDAANILIDNGWMEQPPQAANRDELANK